MAWACDLTYGSWLAYLASTEWRMERNFGFSFRLSGVGGSSLDDPIARSGLGGEVGRSVSR
jgi:hypothetical protein